MVDDQGVPLKLVAFGNIAHGVFAFGNVARGIVAVGSGVSFGVFAFGTNAVGSVLAVGVNAVAPISIALANGGGVFAFALANAFGGFGASKVNGAFSPWAALVLGIGMFVGFWLMPKPKPLPSARPAISFAAFIEGEKHEAWIETRVFADPRRKYGLLLPGHVKGNIELEASEDLAQRVRDEKPGAVFAHLKKSTRLVPVEDDYRAAPHEERVLACTEIEPAKRPIRISAIYRLSVLGSAVGSVIAAIVGIATG